MKNFTVEFKMKMCQNTLYTYKSIEPTLGLFILSVNLKYFKRNLKSINDETQRVYLVNTIVPHEA